MIWEAHFFGRWVSFMYKLESVRYGFLTLHFYLCRIFISILTGFDLIKTCSNKFGQATHVYEKS
jgi:hypothetical protein